MTIKRNCNLVALFVLGLLCIPVNSTRVQAAPVYDDMGNVVSQSVQKTGQAISASTQNVGTVVGQSAQNIGDAFGQGVQNVGQDFQKTTQVIGQDIQQRVQQTTEAIGKGVQKTTEDVAKGAQVIGQGIQQGVQKTTEAVAEGVRKTTEVVAKGIQEGVQAAADVTTEAVDRGSTVVGGAIEVRAKAWDTQFSLPFDELQRNFLAVFGASGKEVPPVLKTGKVINIISSKGTVYFDGHKLCLGNISITDPKTQFYIKRVQAAYMWLQPLSAPGSFVRHMPKGTVGAGADEYLLIVKPADFGYAEGGAWERINIIKGKYLRMTRWDGSITELGGYVVLDKDGTTLTTRNAAGNDYAFSEADALSFIFLQVGSKEAIAYNANQVQRAEHEKAPQLTAVQIASLPAGTKVTIQSAVNSMFLECPGTERMKEFGDTSNWATFSCDNPTRPSAQFTLQKSGNFIGLQASNGKLLEAVSPELKGQPTWVVPGRAEKLEGAARWTVLQKANDICLKNETTGGCMNNRGGPVRVHGNQEPWAPASTDITTVNLKMRLAPDQKMPVLVEPIAPVQPMAPVQPIVPVRPEVPAQPVAPVQPEAPVVDLWSAIGSNIMNLGGVQVIAHPSMEPFNQFVFKSPWYSSDRVAAFTFKAAAKQDVVIVLASAMNQLSGDATRTFTIGGYNNTTIIARPDAGGPIIKPAAGMTILEGENAYATFWITYNKSNGMVNIGKGSVPGLNVLVSWTDPAPLKTDKLYLGVGAWFDPKMGSKVFYNSISAIPSVDAQVAGKEAVVAKVVQQPVASPAVAVEKVAPAKAVARAKTVAPAARKKQAARGASRVAKAPAVAPVAPLEVTVVPEVAPVTASEVVPEVVAPVKKVTAPRARVTRGAANTTRPVRATRVSPAALQ